MDTIATAIEACEWEPSYFLIFSDNVFDPLIYYSHLVPLVLSIAFGAYLYIKNRKSLEVRLLLTVIFFLSLWLFGDLVLWATERNELTMFFWSIINLVEPFVYAFGLYFIYAFISKKDLSFSMKLLIFLPLLPTVILTPTQYAMSGFDLTSCDRDAIEGPLVYYGYVLEIIYTLAIIFYAFSAYRYKKAAIERQQIVLITTGVVLFLLSFAFGNIIGSLFYDLPLLGEDYSWTVGQYGLFGVPVFIGLLSYMIVRFRLFNIGLIAAQALVIALVAVIGSEYAFVDTLMNQVLVSVTLVLTGVLGIMLIRSVRREVEQREDIERLARELEDTNERQETLIHFIGHEVKGFLTKAEGAFAALCEGDFGAMPEKAQPFVREALRQTRDGATSVSDILKASNMKKGTTAYRKEPFDLKDLVVEVVEKTRSAAEGKKLKLTLYLKGSEKYPLTGDRAEVGDHVLRNLIDNAIAYTPSGAIDVTLEKRDKGYVISVKDTGIGISAEDKAHLFTEGGHGKESQKVNIHSTGYGLFIAKSIVEAHGGTIRVESAGPGKGSTFIVELPA